jgi:choline dehydrogenase-like flavoprotein
MFSDLRALPTGTELSADVCIVGAGAAGITMARRLAGNGLRILVLEAGGFNVDARNQELYAAQMSGIDTWQPDDMRVRVFGGSTSHWGGYCMPLLESEFEARPWIPDSGWPITFDDLVPYYRLAQEDLNLAAFLYDGSSVASAEGLPVIEATGKLATYLYQFNAMHMGSIYRDELDRASDVVVQMWANATDIALDASHSRVDHLVVRTLDGGSHTVVADRFVLAMGGLENVRLLLASSSQVDAGVANSSGLVGKYFMEHPHLYGSCVWVEPGQVDLRFYEQHIATLATAETEPRPIMVMGVLGLSDDIREAEGLPHLTVSVRPAEPAELATGPMSAETVHVLNRRPSEAPRLLKMTVRAEQTPLRESAVTLTDAVDELGMPRLDVHWAVSEADLRAYARAMDLLGAELASAGLGRVWTPLDASGRFSHRISPGGHHMGTLRMHSDPARGVVDGTCRAHDLTNLYIAGSAVFTTGGAANPTLTVVALAERLAAHLLGKEAEQDG